MATRAPTDQFVFLVTTKLSAKSWSMYYLIFCVKDKLNIRTPIVVLKMDLKTEAWLRVVTAVVSVHSQTDSAVVADLAN